MSWIDANLAASEAYANTSTFNAPFVNNANFSVGRGSAWGADSGVSDSGATGSSTADSKASAPRGGISEGSGSADMFGSNGPSTSSMLWLLAGAALVAAYLFIKK